jgi:hypothetical protein
MSHSGLTWGKLRHRSRTSSQMTCLLVAMAVGIALAAILVRRDTFD